MNPILKAWNENPEARADFADRFVDTRATLLCQRLRKQKRCHAIKTLERTQERTQQPRDTGG